VSELLRLLAEDRAEDRSGVAGTPGYAEFRARDAARRDSVATILAAGGPFLAEDLYAAAWVFHHGDTTDEARRAHEFARRAAEQGHKPARWLAAATLDRSLMHAGKPQHYGTQIVPDGIGWRVWDVEPATTDAERAKWDVPPLAEQERRAAANTMAQPQLPFDSAPQWWRDAMVRWGRRK
jgi:hypothetical protein